MQRSLVPDEGGLSILGLGPFVHDCCESLALGFRCLVKECTKLPDCTQEQSTITSYWRQASISIWWEKQTT